MDGTAEEITLDENGVCNFCHQAQKSLAEVKLDRRNLPEVSRKIQESGKGKEYDCLIGLSGGLDSSTVLHHAVKFGLRPLCFSVDNGWNNQLADENIMRLVETLKVPFYRYTIDVKKFKELQAAFMKAGLINLEIPTDHILMATTYEMASKYGIKYVLSGGNEASESIMPLSWSFPARDLVHIKDVYRKMMGRRLKGLPTCSLLKFNYYKWIRGIKIVNFLDYLDYNQKKSADVLEKTYGWKEYGGKHCESMFTWWFQNYYLFQKFGIDKRKAHYSSLINSGQLTREEAMEALQSAPTYPHLGLEVKVMQYPKRKHSEFKSDLKVFNAISSVVKFLRWKY